MAISATQNDNTALISALNSGGNGGNSANSGINEVKDRFLKLLVTQLQHQDPMNPMENAELTTQLAQMSTVEGINNMSASLSTLLAGFQASQTLQAASLVGHQVLAEGDLLTLNNSLAGGGVELGSSADSVKVQVLDSAGQVLRTLDLGAQQEGIVRFGWDGLDDKGEQVPDGYYTMRIDASQAGETVPTTALALDGVASVILNDGAMEIDLAGLGQVSFGQIKQIF